MLTIAVVMIVVVTMPVRAFAVVNRSRNDRSAVIRRLWVVHLRRLAVIGRRAISGIDIARLIAAGQGCASSGADKATNNCTIASANGMADQAAHAATDHCANNGIASLC